MRGKGGGEGQEGFIQSRTCPVVKLKKLEKMFCPPFCFELQTCTSQFNSKEKEPKQNNNDKLLLKGTMKSQILGNILILFQLTSGESVPFKLIPHSK
jgi:hypothetical protein